MSRFNVWGVTAATLVALCAGSPALADGLVGSGSWSSTQGAEFINGQWRVELDEVEGRIAGTLHVEGSNLVSSGAVDGSVDLGSITFVADGGNSFRPVFRGTRQGNRVEGTWEFPEAKDSGVWEGSLGPAVDE